MKTIRIVHPDTGTGPYISQGDVRNKRDENDVFWLNMVMHDMSIGKSPEPNEDDVLVKNYHKKFSTSGKIDASSYVFAFTSLEQAFDWFGSNGVLKMIHWYDFQVIEKDVPNDDVIVGDAQCMISETTYNEHLVDRFWTIDELDEYARNMRNKH